jgi:hypothetical protein
MSQSNFVLVFFSCASIDYYTAMANVIGIAFFMQYPDAIF